MATVAIAAQARYRGVNCGASCGSNRERHSCPIERSSNGDVDIALASRISRVKCAIRYDADLNIGGRGRTIRLIYRPTCLKRVGVATAETGGACVVPLVPHS